MKKSDLAQDKKLVKSAISKFAKKDKAEDKKMIKAAVKKAKR